MYNSCKKKHTIDNIVSCDSPVGSGKTTAIMAHLLNQAHERGLRRIFVILPFTNIIEQSVKIYREALVLPGENAELVISELHHRADLEHEDVRYLSALWQSPIIVTTAVSFFETLASKGSSALRRLHQLPGSAIFVDEAHAVLPAKLLTVAWYWMNIYASDWSCYWVLASGSLNRFWQIDEITKSAVSVPEIVDDELRSLLGIYESHRVSYKHDLIPKSLDELSSWISQFAGPRLLIVNTVQSAAVISKQFCEVLGREQVEHLSTALISADRKVTLDRIESRLKTPSDSNWTLVATSCVEAGVNLSFRNGFREISSLTSLLQASGRVNRSGIISGAEMWSFCLAENDMLTPNPGIENSASVLKGYLEQNTEINPYLTTKSIEKELKLYGINAIHKRIFQKEQELNFQFVDEHFRVINSNTSIAIVDEKIAKLISCGKFDWRELQKNSVQIATYKLHELNIPQIADGIYHWTLGYNDFIGYMYGIIETNALSNGVLII